MKSENSPNMEIAWNDTNISNPAELFALIAKLKCAVSSGEMQQYWPEEALFATETKISDINENNVWPADYLEWYFLSTANKYRYKLIAETYHGVGGEWRQIR